MPNKEPGAIRQLFAFVGESNSKMRISIPNGGSVGG